MLKLLILTFLITIVLLPPYSLAQTNDDISADTSLAKSFVVRAKLLHKEAKYDSAEYFFRKAATIYKSNDDWINYLKCSNNR